MKTLKHTVRMALGIGLVVLGVAGLILPVMPGWVFLIPGLLILGDYFPPIRRLVDWAKSRFVEANVQFQKSRQPDATAGTDEASADKTDSPGVAVNRQET